VAPFGWEHLHLTMITSGHETLAAGAMEPAWTASWIWSLPIIGLTLMIHASAVVTISIWLVRVDNYVAQRQWPRWRVVLVSMLAIGTIGWMLALFHGLEAGIWAATYIWLGALPSSADAMLYSLDSITTRGASGLSLQWHWRLMGALEAADGVLLFGISTAFLFAAVATALKMINNAAEGRHQSDLTITPSGAGGRT
jgi:hypothetical protein